MYRLVAKVGVRRSTNKKDGREIRGLRRTLDLLTTVEERNTLKILLPKRLRRLITKMSYAPSGKLTASAARRAGGTARRKTRRLTRRRGVEETSETGVRDRREITYGGRKGPQNHSQHHVKLENLKNGR